MTKRALTQAELLDLPVTVDLPTAGRAFGLSRDGTYDLFKRGKFPVRTVPVGRGQRVPRAELFRVLGLDPSSGQQEGAPA